MGRFLAGYFITGVISSSLSVVGNTGVSAGASGVAFGMLGLLLSGAYIHLGGMTPFLRHRGVGATLKLTVIWFVLGLTIAPFDNWGHLGGLLSGLALGILLSGGDRLRPFARKMGWTALTVAGSALLIAAIHPWPFLYPNSRGLVQFSDALGTLRRGDYPRAESGFTRALELGYTSELLYFNRALARQSQKKLTDAVSDFDAALRQKPDWGDAFYFRGLCRQELGLTKDALADYTSGLQHEPDHLDLRLARANLVLSTGDVETATRDYREALRRAPPDWPKRESIAKWLKDNGR